MILDIKSNEWFKNMAKIFSIPAFKINQPHGSDKAIYVGKVRAVDLINETQFNVRAWDPIVKGSDKQGYQRIPARTRVIKIGRYFEKNKNPIMPPAILVSTDKPVRYENGQVFLNRFPYWIVDGQHRVAGLEYAINELGLGNLKKIEFPIVILSNYKTIEEAQQFHILNTEQKKIQTDLAQRLIQDICLRNKEYKKIIDEEKTWQLKALPIMDKLNEIDRSIWYQAIKLPNEKKKATHIINQVSFISSLKPLLKNGSMSDIKDADLSCEIINNYWLALKKIFPAAFLAPRDYLIQKTPGVFSLHLLLNSILKFTGVQKTSEKEFEEILDKKIFDKEFEQKEHRSNFWIKEGGEASQYGSMKGFKMLADDFIKKL